jgi:hypothetical protein
MIAGFKQRCPYIRKQIFHGNAPVNQATKGSRYDYFWMGKIDEQTIRSDSGDHLPELQQRNLVPPAAAKDMVHLVFHSGDSV